MEQVGWTRRRMATRAAGLAGAVAGTLAGGAGRAGRDN
jgi:hypothetical protein